MIFLTHLVTSAFLTLAFMEDICNVEEIFWLEDVTQKNK